MKAQGFLLARKDAGEWGILESGNPREVRQKYKGLLDGKHDYAELFFSDHYGRTKCKRFLRNMNPEQKGKGIAQPDPEEATYTGPRKRKGGK